jgi:tetratricopeptide (TPR) repeat protein
LEHAASAVPENPGSKPETPDSPNVQRARRSVSRGEALFNAGNYDAALTEFLTAYSLLEGNPRQFIVLSNIGVCHERMFRYDLALRFYERYLQEGGERVDDRREIETNVRLLRALLVTLHIRTNIPAEVWVDNRRVGHAPGDVLVPMGKHLVELRAALYESVRREVTVAAGSLELRFELQGLSRYVGPPTVIFWVGVGLTTAALVTGTVLGANALAKQSSAKARERQDPFLNTREDEDGVKRLALGADIAFGAAVLLGVSTAVVFFLTDWKQDDARGRAKAQDERGFSMQVTPVVGTRHASLQIRGPLP